MNVTAVVLAGGVGTRLYPASSRQRPKQFLSFDDGPSLLARTVERAREVADDVCVLTRPVYADRVRELVPEASVLVEPVGRDTGPALVYAAHELQDRDSTVLLCLPSDHCVGRGFGAVARRACAVAAGTDRLVTLGVEPSRPATGYGYIEPGERHDAPGGIAEEADGYREVAGFYEKPDAVDAERFVEAGYLWNAGVFAWRPEVLLAAARRTPLGSLVETLERGGPDAAERAFAEIESVSIDYGVLERASNLAVVPADVTWDDLGSWDALRRVFGDRADADGNVVLGDALTVDADDCVVATDDDTHVSVVGVSGLTVAAYDDRVLVVPTEDAQRVREVVRRLDADED